MLLELQCPSSWGGVAEKNVQKSKEKPLLCADMGELEHSSSSPVPVSRRVAQMAETVSKEGPC